MASRSVVASAQVLPSLAAAPVGLTRQVAACAPVTSASNAAAHTDASTVLKVDLKDFFPTITLARVKGVFRKAGYREQIATLLALLCTEAPTGLAEVDPATPPRIGDVWAWMAPALIHGVQAFATQGFAPLQAAYAQRDVLLGQSVGLWSTPGQYPADGHPPTQTGVAQGVDAQGALLVHTEQGVQAWHSGDVSVRPHTA